MKKIELAVIPGDGIGTEVVQEGLKVLDVIAELHGGLTFETTEFPWGCEYYLQHGKMMPDNGLDTLKNFDQIFLGAVGFPSVPDHISLWGLLIPIRRTFQQYVNLRPVKLLRGMDSPLKGYQAGAIDFIVVRENSEGEYSSIGGRIHHDTPHETAIQVNYFSRYGIDRTIRYAFELAKNSPRKKLTSATKSNGITFTMPFWDEEFKRIQADYPEVETEIFHIDALAAYFVTRPESFDVVVASNLFADILTDIGGAIMGSIGIAPAANINPEGKYPSMFEPVHGSAPDIAGKGIANPIGQIWTAKMMLDHLGEHDLGEKLLTVIEETLLEGIKTPDLGGKATTTEVGDAICDKLRRLG
ncbi:tartrate dehydrogenase/decarboxylase/D-malate dehydrogenase [Caldalkalibacillus uzonensis]|uniref:D-malate dehydrogenase (decarboxylating) n=1 Tax=Caldalkalibacillus uzonensis TaxID=353224 RepID=A0ABU0CWH8_9BACI|nr:tartrate dehydrogenase [Caldalkalibacillus uzonensis]MDQ0340780.1 tartrate dehydrogenase/decarboxylase/D-malate dehydrogenase [Caldalkalibacillus uzonensis]